MASDDMPTSNASNSYFEDTQSLSPSAGASGGAMGPGAHLGHYEIIEVIGAGGMGVVYRARQESPARDVALKVIRGRSLSRDALRRFEFECNVLGRLQHVGIAQIYDAGFHDGDPYFAMELVHGAPLTEYADRLHLDVRQRLELFVKICDAVQHAHAKGVVHRDLKPGNILVTNDGQPKILDFGVARATDSDIQTATIQTEIGQLVGTVPYMSPEQASGDSNEIDTRSDVYALGVVAYELLAGRLPYDLRAKMIHEAVRVIREDDPAPLSSIHRTLRGDVEVIIGKALAKEKERRYQSAHDLGTDVQRFLNDEPIEARPPSASYQFRKFARRNKALVGGSAAVIVALVLGLAGTLWQASRAAERARIAEAAEAAAIEARAEAQREATTANNVSNFLAGMLQGIGPGVARGRDTTLLREVADNAIERIDAELADEPLVRSRLLRTLGIVYHDLADYDKAEDLIQRSIDSAREATGDNRIAVARALFDLGRFKETQGQLDEAFATFQASREAYVEAGAANTYNGISPLSGAAGVLIRLNRNEEAIAALRDVLAGYRALDRGADSDNTATALNRLSVALSGVEPDSEEALALSQESLAMRRRLYGDAHPDIAESLVNTASQLIGRGELDEAFQLADESVEMHKALFGPRHPYTAYAMSSTASMYESVNRAADAVPLRRESLNILKEQFGPDNRNTLNAVFFLGMALSNSGDFAGAEEQFRAMLDWARANYAAGDNRTSGTILLLAGAVRAQDRYVDAETLYREAYEALRAGRPAGHPQITQARSALVESLVAQSKFDEGETILLRAFEESESQGGEPARAACAALADFYDAWAAADPSSERRDVATSWRTRLASYAPSE